MWVVRKVAWSFSKLQTGAMDLILTSQYLLQLSQQVSFPPGHKEHLTLSEIGR